MAKSSTKQKTYTTIQIEKHLKTMDKLRRRRIQAKTEALAGRGLPPRPRGPAFHFGCPSFFASLRPIDEAAVGVDLGRYERNGGADPSVHVWGASWPDYDQPVDGEALLSALSAAWPTISRPFRRGREPYTAGPKETADLGALAGDPALPLLRFVAEGPGLSIEHAGGRMEFGAECLIVVESLLAFGDKLAELFPEGRGAEAWASTRGFADVFPWAEESWKEDSKQPPKDAEDAFYAAKSGLGAEEWAAHALAHLVEVYSSDKHVPFPDLSKAGTADRPDEERVSKAAELLQTDRAGFERLALHEFRVGCRAAAYYAKWPKDASGERPETSP